MKDQLSMKEYALGGLDKVIIRQQSCQKKTYDKSRKKSAKFEIGQQVLMRQKKKC